MGGPLGIKAGEYWAYRHRSKWPLFRAFVVDPGPHYDAMIKIMVHDGPARGSYAVRRAKLPCKWDDLPAYLETHPEIPRDLEATFPPDLDRHEPNPELEVFLLQEELIRRVVRAEMERGPAYTTKLAFTVAEAAAATGYSQGTIRGEIHRNNLVASYANSKAVIRREELERWLSALPNDAP
ncbi:hypothetical protein SAMN05443544_1873 [Agromyces cerinus subsp. cerinus]|uniref:Helix-turn-helix domain-containing protein n=2 Tax=Agromyces cerinus TaxID=33878 RepID=A0A1N6F9Y3_9MICO|nr:hypothetical protein SAMN05443544_1873 [Agromyces cerinus subsp. cerinus]